jgi:hypothetical protein
MKNWLGIMIIIGAAACQVQESPSPTESTTAAELSNGDLCTTAPQYCKTTMPTAYWWSGLPASTADTVAFIDTKTNQGYWWVYGVDPVLGKVMWTRLAVASDAGKVAPAVATLPAGFMDYTRPPPCNTCPVGDGWLAEHMLETARMKAGLGGVATDLTAACYGGP